MMWQRKIPFPDGCLVMEALATHIVSLAEGGSGIDDLVEPRSAVGTEYQNHSFT
jgi:hypothetical protein